MDTGNRGLKPKTDVEIIGFTDPRIEAEVVDLRRDILEREAVLEFVRGEIARLALLEAQLVGQLFEARMKLQPNQTLKIDKSKLYTLEDKSGTHEG